jgi:hypothetical protein
VGSAFPWPGGQSSGITSRLKRSAGCRVFSRPGILKCNPWREFRRFHQRWSRYIVEWGRSNIGRDVDSGSARANQRGHSFSSPSV